MANTSGTPHNSVRWENKEQLRSINGREFRVVGSREDPRPDHSFVAIAGVTKGNLSSHCFICLHQMHTGRVAFCGPDSSILCGNCRAMEISYMSMVMESMKPFKHIDLSRKMEHVSFMFSRLPEDEDAQLNGRERARLIYILRELDDILWHARPKEEQKKTTDC